MAGASATLATLSALLLAWPGTLAMRPSTLQPFMLLLHLAVKFRLWLPEPVAVLLSTPRSTASLTGMLGLALVSVSLTVLPAVALALAAWAMLVAVRRPGGRGLLLAALVGPWFIVAEWIFRSVLNVHAVIVLLAALGVVVGAWLTLVFLTHVGDRTHRATVWIAAVAVGLVLAVMVGGRLVSSGSPAPGYAPNVLLISIDSLRADHLSCYGYPRPTSPNLDRLASEGTRFATVVSSSTWTVPAYVSLLTSTTPQRHRVVRSSDRLRGDETTLAEVLADAGYATAGIVSASMVRAEYGFIKGFERYDDVSVGGAWGPRQPRRGRLKKAATSSPKVVELAVDWLERWRTRRADRPFFLFLHLWDVHHAYEPPRQFDVFDPGYEGRLRHPRFRGNRAINPNMDPRDLTHLVALYDGEILTVDHYLGELFRYLADRAVLDSTLVVVTADHGDEFFEHGRTGHRNNLYDTTLLIPLLVRYPSRVPAGRVIDRQVRLIDIAPTILSLAGIPRPPGLGEPASGGVPGPADLSALLVGGALPALPAVAHLAGNQATYAALRLEGEKLIRVSSAAGERITLYDLVADPRELIDLAAARPDRVKSLTSWLTLFEAAAAGGPAPQLGDDPAHRDALRSLGYLD